MTKCIITWTKRSVQQEKSIGSIGKFDQCDGIGLPTNDYLINQISDFSGLALSISNPIGPALSKHNVANRLFVSQSSPAIFSLDRISWSEFILKMDGIIRLPVPWIGCVPGSVDFAVGVAVLKIFFTMGSLCAGKPLELLLYCS